MRLLRVFVLFSCTLVLVCWAGTSYAQQKKYPLVGNARFQIGGGLPLPATKNPPPHGRIYATPNAHVTQPSTGPDPKPMTIQPSQLTNPAVPEVPKGQFPNNPKLFEVQSNLSWGFPGPGWGSAMFSAGGRTGLPVTTRTYSPGGFRGTMRYVATRNQFGGPGRGKVGGTAKVWAVAKPPGPPCAPGPNCIAAKMQAKPAPTGAIGASFGVFNSTSPVNQVPGIWVVGAVTSGTIYFRMPTPNSNPGPTNMASSYGGPWTTGQIQVAMPYAYLGGETYTFTGTDQRWNGMGNISLVSSGLAMRALSGPNANRGWLNWKIVHQTPSLSSWAIASLALVLAGGGAAARMSLARRKK